MLPPSVYTSCTMKSQSGVWIMEQLCLQQCTRSACMTGNDQSHKSKKLLNSFGFRWDTLSVTVTYLPVRPRSNKLWMQSTEVFRINENSTLMLLPLTRKTAMPPAPTLTGVNNHKYVFDFATRRLLLWERIKPDQHQRTLWACWMYTFSLTSIGGLW